MRRVRTFEQNAADDGVLATADEYRPVAAGEPASGHDVGRGVDDHGGSRKPLVGEFEFAGKRLIIINLHLHHIISFLLPIFMTWTTCGSSISATATRD